MSGADVNIAGTGDIYCEIIWGDWHQITSVSGSERGGITETEPIILENAAPDDEAAKGTLIIQVWDHDATSRDDFLCAASLKPCSPDDQNIPLYYGQNLGETKLPLWTNEEGKHGVGKQVGHITIDQIHFIQQKLQPYRGCKGQCCCCDDNSPVCCCIETAKSLSHRAKVENKQLLEKQNKLATAIQKADSEEKHSH